MTAAKRPPVKPKRPPPSREPCKHWMLRENVFTGGKQHRYCGEGCGHTDLVDRRPSDHV
jgi:hypothetical protein